MSEQSVDLQSFFQVQDFNRETMRQYANLTHESSDVRERFDTLVNEQQAQNPNALQTAMGLLLLSRFNEAIEAFTKVSPSASSCWYHAQALGAVNRFEDAIAMYETASSQGYDALECDMKVAELRLRNGELEKAQTIAEQHGAAGRDRAPWYLVQGMLLEAQKQHAEALEQFERATTLDSENLEAMFRAARLHDLLGNDHEAIELYERLTEHACAHVNALINLAVLYEDRNQFSRAKHCLARVLSAYPNHPRARLFMKDVESSKDMVIDDGQEQRAEVRDQLLSTPINEFELSVRARNCLKRMNVQSLGDLLQLSEAELLAYKNFGETSLNEIKALLDRKNLHLGQRPDEIDASAEPPPRKPQVTVPPGAEGALTKPVSELELSVRSRRCLQRLNIGTIGDLIQHSEAELLAIRNFGQTSLVEIRARLNDLGLTLAAKP